MTSAELVGYCKALMDRCRRGEDDAAVTAAVATAKAATRELRGQLTDEQKGYIRGILAGARRAATRARRGRNTVMNNSDPPSRPEADLPEKAVTPMPPAKKPRKGK